LDDKTLNATASGTRRFKPGSTHMEGKIKNKIIIISKLHTIEPFKKFKIVLHEFRAKVHN